MAKHTRANKLAAGLVALGYAEVQSKSSKYRTFYCDGLWVHRREMRLHVGRAGALRSGPTITGSVSLTGTATYRHVLRAGEAALKGAR